jgi:hypothetical protein
MRDGIGGAVAVPAWALDVIRTELARSLSFASGTGGALLANQAPTTFAY